MKDSEISLGKIRESVSGFIAERNWEEKQNPKNIAGSIVIEAVELYEHFQWASLDEALDRMKDPVFKEKVRMEIADIMFYLADMANRCDIELGDAFYEKLERLDEKYPADMGLDSERYHEIKEDYRNRSEK
jgi:NTP pyrophosphatase (non-canonical NTP hydrolase)